MTIEFTTNSFYSSTQCMELLKKMPQEFSNEYQPIGIFNDSCVYEPRGRLSHYLGILNLYSGLSILGYIALVFTLTIKNLIMYSYNQLKNYCLTYYNQRVPSTNLTSAETKPATDHLDISTSAASSTNNTDRYPPTYQDLFNTNSPRSSLKNCSLETTQQKNPTYSAK